MKGRQDGMDIKIPRTTNKVVAELDGVSRLITAKQWERAALVASVVRLDKGHGGREETSTSGHFESAREFARRGIVGLSSPESVSKYVRAWLSQNDGQYPKLGAKVTLPEVEFPGDPGDEGSRVSTDPTVAVRQVVARHGAKAIAQALNADVNLAAQVQVEQVRDAQVGRRGVTQEEIDQGRQHVADVRSAMTRSLGSDTAVDALRSAAARLGEAIVEKEQFGIQHPDQEAEALRRIDHLLAAYRSGGDLSQDDATWLDSLGIKP